MTKIKYGVVIPARNEEKNIAFVLSCLRSQSLKPDYVVLVDDGSIDYTVLIASSFCDHIVRLPYHKNSHVGKPELAFVFNEGLKHLKNLDLDYVMILGADHLLTKNYVKDCINYMECFKNVVFVSGKITADNEKVEVPRGSGRIYKRSFLDECGFKHPSTYGFESYFVYKALQLGKGFEKLNVDSYTTRKTARKKPIYKGMKALGFYHLYAIGRSLKIMASKNNFFYGIKCLMGYLFSFNVDKVENYKWINNYTRNIVYRRAREKIFRTRI